MVVAVMQKTGHGLLYKYQSQGPGTSHNGNCSEGEIIWTMPLHADPAATRAGGTEHLTGSRDRVEVFGGEGGTTPDLVRGRIAEA